MNNLLEYFCVKSALAYFIKLMTYRMKTWKSGSKSDRFACCADLQQRRQRSKEPSWFFTSEWQWHVHPDFPHTDKGFSLSYKNSTVCEMSIHEATVILLTHPMCQRKQLQMEIFSVTCRVSMQLIPFLWWSYNLYFCLGPAMITVLGQTVPLRKINVLWLYFPAKDVSMLLYQTDVCLTYS